MKAEYEYYSWKKFDKDCDNLIQILNSRRDRFDGVWGPPRGGLCLAVVLSHGLGIPLLSEPKSERTLIVDDIADSGKTLERFRGKYFMATLFYHRQSVVIPDVWLRRKFEKFIIFPWEKEKK